MLELLIGQIPEAIYFAIFMMLVKQLKEKRVLFSVLMIAEYLLLKHFIKYSIYFQISYTLTTFLILKILYKDKSQLTDIFTFTIGSIILMIVCLMPSFIFLTHFGDYFYYYLYAVITRVLMFGFLFLFRNKLYKIQKLYKKIWNRDDSIDKKIKTTTFRGFNIVMFNTMFYLLNLCMLYAIFLRK